MIVVAGCFKAETMWIPNLPAVSVARVPVGEAAYSVLEETLDSYESPTMILSTGFCGGIDPSLCTGEMVLAEQILYKEEESMIERALFCQAQQALKHAGVKFVSGRVFCTDRIVNNVDEKSDLEKKGAIAVDMESGVLARLATAKGIGFLVLRGVLDPAGSSLPFTANRCIGSSVLTHPWASLRLAWLALIAGRATGRAIPVVTRAFSGGVDD